MSYIWARRYIVGGTVGMITDAHVFRTIHGQGRVTIVEVGGHVGVGELLRRIMGTLYQHPYVKLISHWRAKPCFAGKRIRRLLAIKAWREKKHRHVSNEALKRDTIGTKQSCGQTQYP